MRRPTAARRCRASSTPLTSPRPAARSSSPCVTASSRPGPPTTSATTSTRVRTRPATSGARGSRACAAPSTSPPSRASTRPDSSVYVSEPGAANVQPLRYVLGKGFAAGAGLSVAAPGPLALLPWVWYDDVPYFGGSHLYAGGNDLLAFRRSQDEAGALEPGVAAARFPPGRIEGVATSPEPGASTAGLRRRAERGRHHRPAAQPATRMRGPDRAREDPDAGRDARGGALPRLGRRATHLHRRSPPAVGSGRSASPTAPRCMRARPRITRGVRIRSAFASPMAPSRRSSSSVSASSTRPMGRSRCACSTRACGWTSGAASGCARAVSPRARRASRASSRTTVGRSPSARRRCRPARSPHAAAAAQGHPTQRPAPPQGRAASASTRAPMTPGAAAATRAARARTQATGSGR